MVVIAMGMVGTQRMKMQRPEDDVLESGDEPNDN
jgi:hypothetical protein